MVLDLVDKGFIGRSWIVCGKVVVKDISIGEWSFRSFIWKFYGRLVIGRDYWNVCKIRRWV